MALRGKQIRWFLTQANGDLLINCVNGTDAKQN